MPTIHASALAIFQAAVARNPNGTALCYFNGTLTYQELDSLSERLAGQLAQGGVSFGDRIAAYLQNMPHFPLTALAAWKLGAICVTINPMNRERELSLILADCRPKAMICTDSLFMDVVSKTSSEFLPALVLSVSPHEFQTRSDVRVLPPKIVGTSIGINSEAPKPKPLTAQAPLRGKEAALLVYTSGTTGTPKGAIITHEAFACNAAAFPMIAQLVEGDAVLGIAPLFHITGVVACWGTAMLLAAPLILTYRFDPGVVLDALIEWRPTFVVAAITAFIALDNEPRTTSDHFASLSKVYSGGAAVPASFVERFESKFGRYIHNCYGLTETAAPTHIVPFGLRAPVLGEARTLSIGRAAPRVQARIVQDDETEAPPGVAGELVLLGPMLSPGYWNNPVETAASMRADGFRTGDVAVQDADGWFYIVDRKKDMIISSGYKVWPREVEDVLYTHPAIREAAVVGVADAYRGETVKAFVSLVAGATLDVKELMAYCRARMAAYKYPRIIEVIEELPKTASGKILRRELR